MRGLAPALLLSTILVAACSGTSTPGWTFAPSPDAGAAVGSAGPAPASPAAPGVASGTIEIEAFDLGFTPADPTVDAAGRYTVVLTNTGAAPHDITFADGTQVVAAPGETASGEVDVPAAGLSFICSIPGHEQGGMVGAIAVEGGQAAAPSAEPSHDSHGGPAPATNVEADPNAPAPEVFDPVAPPRLEGDVHDIDLVMTEEPMTVAPGFVQMVWTFGGTVPGPVIRVKVGDTIRVHLKNPAENLLAHSIDFHSSQVAWNDEMRSIAPGSPPTRPASGCTTAARRRRSTTSPTACTAWSSSSRARACRRSTRSTPSSSPSGISARRARCPT